MPYTATGLCRFRHFELSPCSGAAPGNVAACVIVRGDVAVGGAGAKRVATVVIVPLAAGAGGVAGAGGGAVGTVVPRLLRGGRGSG